MHKVIAIGFFVVSACGQRGLSAPTRDVDERLSAATMRPPTPEQTPPISGSVPAPNPAPQPTPAPRPNPATAAPAAPAGFIGDCGPDVVPEYPDPETAIPTSACPNNDCPQGWYPIPGVPPTSDPFGYGSVARVPGRPNEIYVGGSTPGILRSTDYGLTFRQLSTFGFGVPRGQPLAVSVPDPAGPATVWIPGNGDTLYSLLKSTDGGHCFEIIRLPSIITDTLKEFSSGGIYSIQVDPYDPNHLVLGFHYMGFMAETRDGGETFIRYDPPGQGNGRFAFFIDTGSPESTALSWLIIGQEGDLVYTVDGGDTFTVVEGMNGLSHTHGAAQAFTANGRIYFGGSKHGNMTRAGVFVATRVEGAQGAAYRFDKIGDQAASVVWRSGAALYTSETYASDGKGDEVFSAAYDFSGAPETTTPLPWRHLSDSVILPSVHSVAVSEVGGKSVFVADFWGRGLFRYIEP
jgi:hypothetical protein